MYVASVYTGHDASLAIVGEGKIVHLELERFTRKKHDSGNINWLYDLALKLIGISDDDVSCVVGISSLLGKGPNFWTELDTVFKFKEEKFSNHSLYQHPIYIISHYLAHAGYAFYTSPLEDARILTIDGQGDPFRIPFVDDDQKTDCAIGYARHLFGSIDFDWNLRWHPYQKIGWMWISASQKIFGGEYHEGKVMALIGIPSKIFQKKTKFSINTYHEVHRMQNMTTQVVNQLIEYREDDGVCLAGGVALNGIAVYDLLKSREDICHVHVPPSVHDGGLTVGAALYILHVVLKQPRAYYSPETISFCGYTNDELDRIPDMKKIAKFLKDGKIVALVHGKAESGPRALGHRSLLTNPMIYSLKGKLNRIKERAKWRPVAPVIMAEYAHQFFDLLNLSCYHYMTVIANGTTIGKMSLPSCFHYDGTARVQIVESGLLYELLKAFNELTSFPMLLNTSFNVNEPIVNTIDEAKRTFECCKEIDILVIGDKVIERHV